MKKETEGFKQNRSCFKNKYFLQPSFYVPSRIHTSAVLNFLALISSQ
jgi:hypothetical protein